MNIGEPIRHRAAALRADRGALLWAVAVVAIYGGATFALAFSATPRVDPAMHLAVNLAHGRLDVGQSPGTNDTVTTGGRTYQVVSPLPILPYLPFVPFRPLWPASRWIVSASLGILAAWLCLPLARRYGPPGRATYWLATLGAFGTLLFDQAIQGNFYFLAHVEAMLLTFVALIEWRGRRRPWVVGLALGVASLARPTVALAAIPFGLAFLMSGGPDRVWRFLRFAVPVGVTVAIAGLYNTLRFGSPLESGYGISTLGFTALAQRRTGGLFSLSYLSGNLQLLLAQGLDFRSRFPYLVPNNNGHSILLTSPALLIAVGAGIRRRTAQVLWASAFIVTVPLLFYYGGGGFITYGYRYFLDVIPFLLVLVAIAARIHFGALEKLLILLSVVFVGYGFVWLRFQ